MGIYDSSIDYGTGVVLMLWDGDKPSVEEFLEYSMRNYGIGGWVEIEDPTSFRGLRNPGTATIAICQTTYFVGNCCTSP